MSFPISTMDAEGRPAGLTRVVCEVIDPARSSEGGGSEEADTAQEEEHLVLEVRASAGNTLSTLALAGTLAQLEADGDAISALRLLVRSRDDAAWVIPLVEWARAHSLVAVVRTRVRLRPDLVECLRDAHVPVELELAHHQPEIQQALLGGETESVQSLLLQSQHLSVIGIEQSVRLGPLLPGVHDADGFRRLLALVRGADLHRYELFVGQLSADALVLLSKELDSAQALALTRSFGVSPMVLFEGLEATLRLPVLMRRSLVSAYDRIATVESGLAHDGVIHRALEAGGHERGRGTRRGALALELFSEAALAAS